MATKSKKPTGKDKKASRTKTGKVAGSKVSITRPAPTTRVKSAPKKAAAKAAPKTADKKTAALKSVKTAAPKTAAAKTSKAGKDNASAHPIYDLIMKALDQEKGENIVSINLTGKTAIADYMVIVTGTSSRQVSAMAEKLRDKLSKAGYKSRIEGKGTGDWVILDAGDVIVHLFRPEVREFYNLEKLWGSDFSTVGYNLYTS